MGGENMKHDTQTRGAMPVSRRGFIVGAGAAASTVTMGLGLFTPGKAVADVSKMISPTLFFDIHADESVVIHIQKAEVGQHVGTALAQIVADELEADCDKVTIDYIGYDPRLGLHLTGGSWSINWTFDALSRVGASGRITMLEAAAQKFGGEPSDYTAHQGVITGNGHMVTYGALVASGIEPRTFTEDEMKAITLKTAEQRHYVGQSVDALDIPAKSTGKACTGSMPAFPAWSLPPRWCRRSGTAPR